MEEVCTMKTYLSRGKAAVVRGGLIGSLISLVGNSVIADEPVTDVSMSPISDDPIIEDVQDENRPILELDPERSYASEALLSFRSKIAPYGKLIAIRRSASVEFRDVQTWKEVEEFVAGIDDGQIVAKVKEPWGTEVIVTVTVNRTKFPSRSRPSEQPPTAPKPAESTPTPIVPAKPAEASTKPVETSTKPAPVVTVERLPLEPKSPAVSPAVSAPSKGATFGTSPVEPTGLTLTPADPVSGPGPEVTVTSRPSLQVSEPKVGAPLGRDKNSGFVPQPVSPEAMAMTPPNPSSKSKKEADRLVSTAMLALVPTIPIPAGVEKVAKTPGSIAYVLVISTGPARNVRTKPVPEPEMTADQENWLRDAVDLADRLGILSVKPLVTSDRRQNAFALYSLFMAIKDLRFEMDLTTRQLEEALDTGASPQRIAQINRSVEKGMSSIMRWDTSRMQREIQLYSAELNSIGDVRRMISFLASLKSTPKNGVRLSSE